MSDPNDNTKTLELQAPVERKQVSVSGPCSDLDRQARLTEMAAKAGKVQLDAAIEKQLTLKEAARQVTIKASRDLDVKLKEQIGRMAVAMAVGMQPLVDLASAASKLFGGTVRAKDLLGAVHYFQVPHNEDLARVVARRCMSLEMSLNFQMPVLATAAYRKKHELGPDCLEEGEEGALIFKAETIMVTIFLSQPMIADMLKLQEICDEQDKLEAEIKQLQKKREDGPKLLDQAVAVAVRTTLQSTEEGRSILQSMDAAISQYMGTDEAFLNLLEQAPDDDE